MATLFALLNTHRWEHISTLAYWNARRAEGKIANLEGILTVVPVLYFGPFCTATIDAELQSLGAEGSRAVPGFMDPEGVVVWDRETGSSWKKTLGGDGHKGPKLGGEDS